MHTEIIAEIGLNHNGNPVLCKKLIDCAVDCGVDYVKFQMRQPSLYRDYDYYKEDLSTQYIIDLINKYNMPNEIMYEMFDYTKNCGIVPICTPFDLGSIDILSDYGMQIYKIASCDLTNTPLLHKIVNLGKRVICSTGMSTEQDIEQACKILSNTVYNLLHCNSTYPTPFKDINLQYMQRLKEISNRSVGYSGHERGIEVPIAAVAMGAIIIEKHITLTPDADGSDHKVSLTAKEFKNMVVAIRNIEDSMGSASPRTISTGELINKSGLAKSIIAKRNIADGETIDESMIQINSPGGGLEPNKLSQLIGTRTRRPIKQSEFFFESDLTSHTYKTQFSFTHPWGFPVRFHDYEKLLAISNPDFVEFHLTYQDLNVDLNQYLKPRPLEITIHAPDIFENSHLLDLASSDQEHVKHSIECLHKTLNIAKQISSFFSTKQIKLIVSSGCVTKDEWINEECRYKYYDQVGKILDTLPIDNIEIIMQTLPPFPWYFGGQYYINIFTEPVGIKYFCQKYKKRICFDTSHSQLACNYYNLDFKKFISIISPYIAHMHLSDASGTSNEGEQIGNGDVNFEEVKRIQSSFIPEIWRGHENNYIKMWEGLEKLERRLQNDQCSFYPS